MENRPRSSRASWLFALAVFFFILTFSIALPIYIRPFYYAHVSALDLPQTSGFTAHQIITAYDRLMDYLTLPGVPFSTGELTCSADAQAHFADCKVLFDLNTAALLVSSTVILIMLVLRRMGKLAPLRMGRRSAGFWAAVSAVVLPLIIGGLAALDFNRAFVIFHSIFFPGKDNWLFNWNRDQIIRVLPQTFFMHCAILIGAGVLLLSGAIILMELLATRKEKPAGAISAPSAE